MKGKALSTEEEVQWLSLLFQCRRAIRRHMMEVSRVNLFYRVPKLGLPTMLQDFLLYDKSVEMSERVTSSEDEGDNVRVVCPSGTV